MLAVTAGTAAHGQDLRANAEDFVIGADLCMTLLHEGANPADFLEAAGWVRRGSNPVGTSYIHGEYGVQIITSQMLGTPSCQVDGYLNDAATRDDLDEMIESRLSEHFGDKLNPVYRHETVPGAGFMVEQALAALSFEDRTLGLSTRFTAMIVPENEESQ